MNKLLHPKKIKIAEMPEAIYTSEKLENLRLYEWPAHLYKEMRQKVFDKWNYEYPNKKIEKSEQCKYQIDHIIPFSKGGKTELDNLQPLLVKDNLIKGDKM